MLLGCIGDDFTGSGDLANVLAKGGMRTVQYCGIPTAPAAKDVEAGVVALKTRSIAVDEAVRQSLAAFNWLREQGCSQFFFKYCSTFDSRPEGNIGPVMDALAHVLDARQVIVCPAFPATGRTVFQGHLFVVDVLLNESGMENHPITPMTDPDIRRWLARQSRFAVGHVPIGTVSLGADAMRAALAGQQAAGRRHIVVDAIRDTDLQSIGLAARDLPLITGGSGVALGLPSNFGCVGAKAAWDPQGGRAIALSGSCSHTTRAQIAAHEKAGHSLFRINVADLIEGRETAQKIAHRLLQSDGLPLAYTSADPEAVRGIQNKYGHDCAADAVETCFAEIARIAVANGVTRLITAGGETSGAIIEGLELSELSVGPEIDSGVPALRAGPGLVLALKSGNFGSADFFDKANGILGGQ